MKRGAWVDADGTMHVCGVVSKGPKENVDAGEFSYTSQKISIDTDADSVGSTTHIFYKPKPEDLALCSDI